MQNLFNRLHKREMLHELLVKLQFEEVQSAKEALLSSTIPKPITAISTNFRIHGANNYSHNLC
jgi:hypothetical protein